nr:RNA-dependent RNA polymerase [Flumine sobemo-like virus 31]
MFESNKRVLPQYIPHLLPNFLSKYNRDEWSRSIDEMKNFVKPDASPGSPCALISNRNDDYMRRMGERFNDIVLDRIEKILSFSLEEIILMGRKERMDHGMMDPVRVFVKNEPHKLEKIKQGRVRLIMSVSLVDKMIEMLISRHLCKLEIQNWQHLPSKPGIGFTRADNEQVFNDIMDCGLDMSYADISGWDMNVKQWMIRDEAEAAIMLCVNSSEQWEHLMRCKAIIESESIYQFSDGILVAPRFKGIVNSGKLRTSRGNSFMRVRIADLVGSRKTIAAGDDTVENTVENAKEKYLRYGVVLKDYVPVEDSFEFCSHYYAPGRTYAVNHEKLVMNLLHQEPKTNLELRMTMIGFEDEMDSHPQYDDILRMIESVGYFEVEGPHYEINKDPENAD